MRTPTSHDETSNRREVLRFAPDAGVDPSGPPSAELNATSALGLEPIAGWSPPSPTRPEAGSKTGRRLDASSALALDEPDTTPEVLIGTDDRVRIHETTGFPWRTICSLTITTTTGEQLSGTGFMVSPRTVITAGHCVFLPSFGGWVARVDVVPGHNGRDRPYSTVTTTEFRSVRGWTEELSREFDYAAILLPPGQGLPELGHLGYAVYDEASLLGAYLNVAGYPIDKPEGTLWWAARASKAVRRGAIVYDLDTEAGQSGAPVWRLDAQGRRLVVGIHTNGKAQGNSATRITDEVFANIQRWAEEGRE